MGQMGAALGSLEKGTRRVLKNDKVVKTTTDSIDPVASCVPKITALIIGGKAKIKPRIVALTRLILDSISPSSLRTSFKFLKKPSYMPPVHNCMMYLNR